MSIRSNGTDVMLVSEYFTATRVPYQIAKSTEQAHRRALLIRNYQPLLVGALDVEILDDRAGTRHGMYKQLLIHLLGILRCLEQKSLLA